MAKSAITSIQASITNRSRTEKRRKSRKSPSKRGLASGARVGKLRLAKFVFERHFCERELLGLPRGPSICAGLNGRP